MAGPEREKRPDLPTKIFRWNVPGVVSRAVKAAARTSPARLTLLVFTAMILLFTMILELPISSADGTRTPFVDALFTAVSAVCVTGLVTVETGTHWSVFGLTVIMVAMKVGGLGVLTLASLLGLSVMRHMGLAQRIVTARETKTEQLSEVGGILRTIVITSTGLEVVTFLLLMPFLLDNDLAPREAVFNSVFYAISAFNNAGFVPEAAGTLQYVGDPRFSIPVALAVFIGSLGFPVILVLVQKWRTPSRWSLHANLTIWTSLILLVGGAVSVAILEWTNPNTLGSETLPTKFLASLFMSVMPRSGGFATLDVSAMEPETWIVLDLLMFIGGGSGSTGGGIKVTTFALLVLSIIAEARGDRDVEIFNRRIPHDTIRQAIAVLVISTVVIFVAALALLRLTPYSLDRIIFEVVSAYATCGLSTGITPFLNSPAKYALIACMYVGRVGPMTLGAALALRSRQRVVRLPEERPVVG